MLEKVALLFIGLVAVGYITMLIIGMIVAFPFGLIGLVVLAIIGGLFVKVLLERLSNQEDEYYSKNVKQ